MERIERYRIGDLEFEWDIYKGSANITKHGVTFWEQRLCLLTRCSQKLQIQIIPKTRIV